MTKPKTIFIDADAFIALQFYKHPNYPKAIVLSEKIDQLQLEAFTCTYTLLEVATIINMYFAGKRGPKVAGEIINNPQINIIKGDDFFEKGLKKMKQQKSKNVSLNDCVYFSIVDELKIDLVFSFDRHWKSNGFELLEPYKVVPFVKTPN